MINLLNVIIYQLFILIILHGKTEIIQVNYGADLLDNDEHKLTSLSSCK